MAHQTEDWVQRAAAVQVAVFDVDGVLTDGRLYFSAAGEELKAFHARDGLGLKSLRRAGIAVAVLSGRDSPAVNRRMESLGIDHVVQGRQDKLPAFDALLEQLGCARHQACYAGDDRLDLPVMQVCGFAAAPADAIAEVRAAAHRVTEAPGGHGAAREIADWLLAARGAGEPTHQPCADAG